LPDRVTGRSFATRSEVLARNGIAATSHPLATEAALDVLKQGGSAVDAAIAANAVLGVVEPTGCGIGGDLFAIVWDAGSGKLHGLNGSGRSPRSLTRERLLELGLTRIPSFGPLSVSVPGAVDGWFALHGRFGKLSMSRVLAPAIEYAREGFPVTEIIAFAWAQNAAGLANEPGFARTFLVDGRSPRKGEIFRNRGLAETLEALASGGRDAFYRGGIAERIASFVKSSGGFLDADDLARHASEWVDPVSTRYRGYDVWELPPNGQGIAALQILNVLEGFDVAELGFGSADYAHLFFEAKKLAFEDRARFYADPDFFRAPVEELISKEYAERRRALIDLRRAALSVEPGNPALSAGDTVYLTTADGRGNMVSLIQSNFRGMGSGVCPEGLGFGLQDRGELFTLEEGHPNVYAPGKRPFHTIIPAFITKDGSPFLSFGVMGGDTQPQMHVQIVSNIVDFGMNVQEAGDAPRMLHSGSSGPTGGRMRDGGEIHLESGFSEETRRELAARGHVLTPAPGAFGGYQAIGIDPDTGVYSGASESRKDGHAAGY
jgi:gamma-glutamyltranspeptidase/glutathione hydrolase